MLELSIYVWIMVLRHPSKLKFLNEALKINMTAFMLIFDELVRDLETEVAND